MTGSFISSLVIGHRNSSGASEPLCSAFSASIFLRRRPRRPTDSEKPRHCSVTLVNHITCSAWIDRIQRLRQSNKINHDVNVIPLIETWQTRLGSFRENKHRSKSGPPLNQSVLNTKNQTKCDEVWQRLHSSDKGSLPSGLSRFYFQS